jgi:hypothetical protein
MATSFDKIYDKFLSSIDDKDLANEKLTDDDLAEICFNFLEDGLCYFKNCQKDLTKINKPTDTDHGSFVEDLDPEEIKIITMCMKKEWLSSKVMNSSMMEKEVGDRDYKAIQGTPYLKQLSALDDKLTDDIRSYTISYSYNQFNNLIGEW